jgi:hypothetical protein
MYEKSYPWLAINTAFSREQCKVSAFWFPSPSHLTSCTPTKSNLYFSNSPTTDLIAPILQRLLIFQVPNHILFFRCLNCVKDLVQVWGGSKHFVTIKIFCGEGLLAPHPTPKLEGHPLSAVRDCLFNIFAVTLRIWRPSLRAQPEDAPCNGDK